MKTHKVLHQYDATDALAYLNPRINDYDADTLDLISRIR